MLTENVFYAQQPELVQVFPYGNSGRCRVDFPVDIEEVNIGEETQYQANVYSLQEEYTDSLLQEIMENYDDWLELAQKPEVVIQPKKATSLRSAVPVIETDDERSKHRAVLISADTGSAGTVYGGTVDLVSGLLTVDKKMETFDGSEPWGTELIAGIRSYYLRLSAGNTMADRQTGALYDILSNMFHSTNRTEVGQTYVSAAGYLNCRVGDNLATVQEWTDYLASNNLQVCYPLATPQTYQLTAQEVELLVGSNRFEGDTSEVVIRLADSVRDIEVLTEMPLTVTATGAGEGGITTMIVERAEDYKLDRPDENEFNGHKGETVLQASIIGSQQVSFDTDNLQGSMDDGATYNLIVTIKDGLGQTAEETLPFEVHWSHQAAIPSAEIEIDEEELIAFITPIAPEGAAATDVADIYRLSADKPELIVEGATFGETYVDPYPALGDMGGHRIVTRTNNGDYITGDNQIAMVDSPELEVNPIENEDLLNIIDFDGRQIRFYWETNYSNTWAKDFQETQYLGGSVEGDWNAAVSRSGTLSSKAITVLDQEMLKDVRRLAEYPGICHVRTADGSSYAADVQVSEDYVDDEKNMVVNYSLSITRVNPQELDGMTVEQWEEENPTEEEES